jgi:hypothetical protein
MLGAAATHPVTAFHHVWLAEVIAGLVACLAVALTAVKPADPSVIRPTELERRPG